MVTGLLAAGGCERDEGTKPTKPADAPAEPELKPRVPDPPPPMPGEGPIAPAMQPADEGTEEPDTAEPDAAKFTITSPAFEHDGPIPEKHTADGEDVSPQIAWSNVPEGTEELVLICEDPIPGRREPFVHWMIYKIDPTTSGLPEGLPAVDMIPDMGVTMQGKTSWGTIGYRGPAPPPGSGTHYYHFRLFAVDVVLAVERGTSKHEMMAAMNGRVIAEAELIGTYER